MNNPSMSILLPSVRPNGIPMVDHCLSKQTFQDWELIVAMPERLLPCLKINKPNIRVIAEPPKREGDFYRLNGAWNRLIAEAQADLLVFCVDWIWFEPDALERFADSYALDPKVGVSSFGDHYCQLHQTTGRPEVLTVEEKRLEMLARIGHKWEMFPPVLWEAAMCSMSKSEILKVGGFDEDYDRGAGNSEKELAYRMYANGYRFAIDPKIPIRIWQHGKASDTEWDAAYAVSSKMWAEHYRQIAAGERTKA